MLAELWIADLAVVERLHAEFRPGLNVLTGETGAGKSLLVGAIDLALGARGTAGLVRKGALEAEIVARFELDPDYLRENGIEESLEEGALLLRRTIGADGRSRAYVNDRPAAVGRLRELGAVLADLHGQHEQQQLKREETHLDHLDAYGDLTALRKEVEAAYRAYVRARDALAAFDVQSARSAEERETLRREQEELTAAGLVEGEVEDLEREHHRVAHAEKLAEAARGALEALCEGKENAVRMLAAASRFLEQGARLDGTLDAIRRPVEESLVAAEEAGRDVEAYLQDIPSDPARLDEIERRVAFLTALERRYRRNHPELLTRREELGALLGAGEEGPRRRDELERALEGAETALAEASVTLSTGRTRAATGLGREVSRELRGLGMAEARFRVEIRPPRSGLHLPRSGRVVGPRGAEEAAFMLAANPGEAEGPLAEVASGGESSRVMLALRNVLGAVDPVPIVLFDEVDAGIGGLVAQAVAGRLAALARERQVLVVTHLAVIAGKASHHLRLVKATDGKRTRLRLETLDEDGREAELARMLVGSMGGDAARRTARALMEEGAGR